MDSFNLYKEAKDYYDQIIPKKTDGLILLSLYEKFREDNFNENDFLRTINQTLKDLGKQSSRKEYERNNSIILRLQDYFIWRDKTNKTYRLKPYGLEFCKRTQKRLIEGYSPAKIKRWFDDLYNRLKESVDQGDFKLWIEDHFNERHIQLGEQIEILDQQVNESVEEFKKLIKSEENKNDIIAFIRSIENKLEVIKEQAIELSKAFRGTYDIDEILTNMLQEEEQSEHLIDNRRVREFNNHVRSQLEQVSQRIDKIKPRIREFIYDFNQRDFDRKTDRFLTYLLTYSKSSQRNISLPKGIPRKIIRKQDLERKFTIIPEKDISPKTAQILSERKVNQEGQKKMLNKALKWKYEKDRVKYWTRIAVQKIEQKGELTFSPFFFKILKEEEKRLSIGVKTAQQVLEKSFYEKDYSVTIDKEKQSDEEIKNLSLWEMRIQKK
ncbi:hypothetical protein [Winogradskyella sp. Asnod2-B02-A]|uniref:hypothetical protein n=1 Tax=Winogradskyella sp. Asnod2-B02-A TaxID=3160583 RepID=UPI00386E9771